MRSRFLRTVLASVLALEGGSAATTAAAAATTDPPQPTLAITNLAPLNADGALTGPFTVDVQVTLNGSASVRAMATLGYSDLASAPEQTVTAAQCPTTCTISFAIDPTTWEEAFPSDVEPVEVYWDSEEGQSGSDSQRLYYAAPVDYAGIKGFERDETSNTSGFATNVMDTGGSLVIEGPGPRGSDEVIQARVYPWTASWPTVDPVLTGTGSWSDAGDAGRDAAGRVRLDTAALPVGTYRVIVRSRDAAGHFGWSVEDDALIVRHTPVVTPTSSSHYVTEGAPITVGMAVTRPLPDGVTWSALRLSVDGGDPQTTTDAHWNVPTDLANPVTSWTNLPGTLPPGVHTVTIEVLDTAGNRIGAPATATFQVVAFTDTITPARTPLVVGVASSVLFAGTAPADLTYQQCTFIVFETTRMTASGNACPAGVKSYNQSVPWTPQTAGAGRVELYLNTVDELNSVRRLLPVTIYAQRFATLSAPAASAYGARLTATVTVSDETSTTGPFTPGAAASVTLQRKAAGSTTWATVGTGTTDTSGRALVTFTNSANGRLRAVVTPTIPGTTVLTAERALASASRVSWSSLPTSARRGQVTYAAVLARPYDRGATVRVQVRRLGTSAWTTVGSANVYSSGYARAAFRVYSRGTWEVRVARVGTVQHTVGYSAVRQISIR